jgi:hypothetical protein
MKNEPNNSKVNPVTAENNSPKFVAGNPVNKDSAEHAKTEQKPVRNLEETIKFLEALHDLKVKRDKFITTIQNLDAFEIDLKKEAEETDSNYYQGCQLTIEDDNHRKFITKNPIIIWTVAQQITSICEGRLAELEAKLVITA